jgi:DNA-directed RNA polymerase specialized sigma24 family protein
VENPRLFGILVDRYQTAFVRKAFTIVRNEAEAEDVLQ